MNNKRFRIENNIGSANVKYSDMIQDEIELLEKEPRISMTSSFDEKLGSVPEILKEQSSMNEPTEAERLKCKYCVYDGIFEHDGFDPVNKRGVWKKGKKRICTKRQSLESQNNNGVWYVCDIKNMKKCHFFEPRK